MDQDIVYYPDFPCHLAKLRPGSAPKEGCNCDVCRALTRTRVADNKWVPVVKSREPFIGILEREK